jgi:hypothetical protein
MSVFDLGCVYARSPSPQRTFVHEIAGSLLAYEVEALLCNAADCSPKVVSGFSDTKSAYTQRAASRSALRPPTQAHDWGICPLGTILTNHLTLSQRIRYKKSDVEELHDH